MNLSVVIPVFNDTSALPALLDRLQKVAETNRYTLDVIMVDDGSSASDTWASMKSLKQASAGQHITLIRLNRNVGQHLATLIGLRQAQATWAITMDADLQHPPEEIPKLVRAITEQGADLVYGTTGHGHSAPYRLLSRAFKRIAHKRNDPVDRDASSFRALDLALIQGLDGRTPFVAIDTPLQTHARSATLVATEHHRSQAQQSSYSLKKRSLLALFALCSGKSFYRAASVIVAGFLGVGLLKLFTTSHGAINATSGAAVYILFGMLLAMALLALSRWQQRRIQRAGQSVMEMLQ